MAHAFGTAEAWEEWREGRDASLHEPYGWFSLVELTWLDETPRELEHFPGLWSASEDGQTITVALPEGECLYRDGNEVTGSVEVTVAPGVTDRSLRDARGREIEVMYRFGRPGIRVRDPHAPALANDHRIARYKFSTKWVLRGRMRPFTQTKEIVVDAAVEGGQHTLTAWGEAEVALPNDETVRLTVTGDGPQSSRVMFSDCTSGDTTAEWRSAPIAVDGETVVIDFNRATIFPAHMSPYGTCPKPPKENFIDAKVRAGEKKVEKP